MDEISSKIVPTGDSKQWYMTVEDVAQGYGVDRTAVMQHLNRHADELRDGIEKGVTNSDTLGGPQQKTVLYREGVIKLGFFIRSPQAKAFRQWATNLVIQHMDERGMSMQDLFVQMREQFVRMDERFDRLDRIIDRQQDEIDELRAIIEGTMSEDQEKKLQALIREVSVAKGMDGRAVLGHLRKTLGCHTPYEKTTLPRAMNLLNNLLGRGLTTIK